MDDEQFWLPDANLLSYDRRLNMKSATLDRDILWETPAGKHVRISSRRLVSLANRHVAAISYCVTLLNADAHVVISSEMVANPPSIRTDPDDPRQMRVTTGRVLHPRTSYSNNRRIVLCHATDRSRLTLACATDQGLETACTHTHKVVHTDDFGQVAFAIEAGAGCPVSLTKYMVYHTSQTMSERDLSRRAEWTMDRVTARGFQDLLVAQEQYMDNF